MNSEYNITVMGIEFYGGNLGCSALAYSFLFELQKIAEKKERIINVTLLGYNEKRIEPPDGINIIDIIRIRPKSLHFWKNIKKCFEKSDIIFDFTLGDSFSDIYGMKRFVISSMLKQKALDSRKMFVLAPQTYGPYKSFLSRTWASEIIKHSTIVFSRDQKSSEIIECLSGRKPIIVTDIAFALPYQTDINVNISNRIRIGINPSGLLWNGGYTGKNQFGLNTDYQEYCNGLISQLLAENLYEIHLIPHVNPADTEGRESDLTVCEVLQEKYPEVIVERNIRTPMDAKAIIATMDVLVAARMHATVAGLSTLTATIPVAYSSKFEGLFDNVGYDYIIDARESATGKAIEQTLDWIHDREKLKESTKQAMDKVHEKHEYFRVELLKLFENCDSMKGIR